ncbi:hypothetical protein C7S16_5298 [Burkholderia thailandensis]|uniref:Uncharacterized protein n=1 Tax=Burkholderia thailandensis TaxID=57975 RepID=A0AAW9CMZ4_BURTH|nr:hypothetical protein [Burkholderia thailandensis]MDW9250936.1 hypothetical protein [Burkholderia thailandensis]
MSDASQYQICHIGFSQADVNFIECLPKKGTGLSKAIRLIHSADESRKGMQI